MITWVIGNAPSNRRWHGVDLHPSIGCNLAIKDFALDHLVVVDRVAMHEINKLPRNPKTQYWCKSTVLPAPEGWTKTEPAGVDSGSTAIKLAAKLYPMSKIYCIGFDGVLGTDNSNAYSYRFRPKPTPDSIREKHRQAIYDLLPEIPNIVFVHDHKHPRLETTSYDEAFKEAQAQSRIISKISNQA